MIGPLLLLQCLTRGAADGIALARNREKEVISLGRRSPAAGLGLLSGPLAPLADTARDTASVAMASHWAWRQIAEILLERGYAVDAVSGQNRSFIPRRPYEIFVGSIEDFARLAPLMPGNCAKVLYLDDADVLFRNHAELDRLVCLKDRRGAVLVARRHARLTPALESATAAILHGNDWTRSTYRHARIPLHGVPTVRLGDHASPETKDFDACRRGFLWPGGRGLVRTGLDRVLEAFVGSPELELTVCGPVAEEPDFASTYARELNHTANIVTVGSVDVTGSRYADLARRCVALVFPSGAEGQAEQVVAGMGAGLIPIVSRESGVDVDGAGVVLNDCSVATVTEAVRHVASLPAAQLRAMAESAWRIAQEQHAPAVVRARYRDVLAGLLGSA